MLQVTTLREFESAGRLPRRLLTLLCLAALLALTACGGARSKGSPRDLYGPGPKGYHIGKPYQINGVWYYPAEDPNYDRVGIASWYGREFHGRRTANGEVYNRHRFTAAHTTLPLPVIVRVTNLENGRSTLVRVNDRGPFIPGRIIDVSEAAAERLGFRMQGLVHVRVQFVSRADRRGVPAAGGGNAPSEPLIAGLGDTAGPGTVHQ